MVCAAKIVEVVPDMDAKFYAATQTMDEARHVEAFSRFLQEKVGMVYPINTNLTALLEDTLQRLALGHALPRHAGAHRRSCTRRVRGAA